MRRPVRRGEREDALVSRIIDQNSYNIAPSIEGATVIDVGANIGCFSLACAERGASSLHCYEADPVTASICRQNLSGLDGVTVEPVAVWGGAIPPEIRFSRHSPDDSGIGSMVFDDGGRGEVVPTIDIDDVLTSTCDVHGGNITILKMDCEGAEYPIIYGSRRLELVDNIVMEYHEIRLPISDVVDVPRGMMCGRMMVDFLRRAGFHIITIHIIDTGLIWAVRDPDSAPFLRFNRMSWV